MTEATRAVAAVFDPVQAPTTFEETVERLGTAIRLGLLGPGSRLPPERELADQLGISRSTLRQAIRTLTESGHLTSLRGRSGGTFVSAAPPLRSGGEIDLSSGRWRDLLDYRVAVECGAALLAAERATNGSLDPLRRHIDTMETAEDFSTYRQADVFWHLALAEASESPRIVAAMTEVQGEMTELIDHIPHPAHVLGHANEQHLKIIDAIERRDGVRAVRIVREHLEGTEHILAGLLP